MAMRARLWLWAALAMVFAACGPRVQIPPTVIVELPTTAPTVEPTLGPTTPALEPTTAAVTETPEGTGGGGEGAFVLLVDYAADTPQITVADPTTGEAQGTFGAPGLTEFSLVRVGGPFIFYSDQLNQKVVRAGVGGATTELPFVSEAGPDYMFLPSADGTMVAWGTTAFDLSGGNATHVTLNIASTDGSNVKTVLDETLQDVSILPQPIQWSPDGKYVYYTDEPYGIGGYILFSGGPNLKRVDVGSGTITELLPDQGCLCPMTVSPDGETVATLAGTGPLELVLHDVATGGKRRLPVDSGHLQAGDIVWSPDGEALMYTMAISNFENPDAERYAVVRVDVGGQLSQQLLLADDDRLLDTIVWPAADTVWLNDKNGNSWRMNPATGEVTLAATGKKAVR